jgi:hypothetical protein
MAKMVLDELDIVEPLKALVNDFRTEMEKKHCKLTFNNFIAWINDESWYYEK